MQLYDSRTNELSPFQPLSSPVLIYVCGITPYDTTHLGHAFTYAVNDILIRYLEFSEFQVKYVQNVTDIDDDILRKAREDGDNWFELGNRWTTHFMEDMRTLNVRPPDEYPRATDVIPEIIETVQALQEQGLAYAAGGSVYYQVDKWSEFGQLSKIERQEMLPVANERGNVPDDPNKRDPLDFVLWQAHQEGEPGWQSPWGLGRPGWHIECSTMSSLYLGPRIDIHSGGADLLFPHHECEIAQIEPVTGEKPFVQFWVHTAMVEMDGEKMSKSLGNLVMARDLLQTYSPDAIRVYLANHHYRSAWGYDEGDLRASAETAEKMRRAAAAPSGSRADGIDLGCLRTEFTQALDADLNTPSAVRVLHALADDILRAAESQADIKSAQQMLRTLASVLGLRLDQPSVESRVRDGWQRHLKRFAPEIPAPA